MSLRTLCRLAARPVLGLAFLLASASASATPEAFASFYPPYMDPGGTTTLTLSLHDTQYQLVNASVSGFDFSPFTLAGPITSDCGTVTQPTATSIAISGMNWLYIYPYCNVNIPISYSGALTQPGIVFPAGVFSNQTAGVNPSPASASICVTTPLVVTTTKDTSPVSTPGSLRAAIESANQYCAAPLSITFNIGGGGPFVIKPVAELPAITATYGVTIDGYSQGGAAANTLSASSNDAAIAIALDGSSCGACSGLVLQNSSVVHGLSIHSFQLHGIDIQNYGSQISGNYIGVDPLGAGKGNGVSGVHVGGGNANIGWSAAADANLIGANPIGIWVEANASIAGNQIGGLRSGAPGNGNGVGIRVTNTASISGNVVRYSAGTGIAIAAGARGITRANASFANGGPGIDINEDGPTPNGETAPTYETDNVLNYPVITSVERVGGNTLVNGYLKSYPGPYSRYDAELYANSLLRGQPEGEQLVWSFRIVPDSTGFALFSETIPGLYSHISTAAVDDTCGDGCVVVSEYSYPSAAALALSPAAVSFPDRPVNTSSAPVDVTILNSGNETMAVSSITVTGDFTLASSCPPSLAAGGSCVASVTFRPLVLGARSGTLTVATDAPSGTQSVRLAGNGLASTDKGILDVSPGLLDFDRVGVGSRSAPQLVTLSNSGVLAINLVVSTVGDFSRVPAPPGATDCGATLAPREVCEIAIVFAPSVAGAMSGKLVFDSDASNAHVEVSLFGTGAQPAAPARSLVLPDHVSFGTLPVGLKSPATSMILTNATRQPLAITELTITGDFSIGDSCTTVPAGGTCAISLFFTPSARGARTGTLTLRAAGDPYVVALDGTGGANLSPVLSVSPLRIGFGNAVIGPAGPPASVELRNIGEVPVELASQPNLGEFLVTSHCQAALAPGDRCTMDVEFFPRVQGLRAAVLEIRSNAVNGPHRVELSGVGCSLPNTARSRIPQLVCSP